MAAEFLKKGWNVVATVRTGPDRTKLQALAEQFKGRLEIGWWDTPPAILNSCPELI